jgi:S1-C subfamily serine protease
MLVRITLTALVFAGLAATAARAHLASAASMASAGEAMAAVVSVLPEWPPDAQRNEEPEGSGVAIFDGRRILTALHVVDRALAVRVRTSQGEVIKARVAALDRASDLALMEIDAPLPALQFAGDAELGDPVCAIGNAFGLGLSVTCGVVSGINRAGVGFNAVEDFVQTDAAVNPGASGGALVDDRGRLVGILSAIFTKTSDANIGVNFAVSAPLAKRVAVALRDQGAVPWLASGVQLVASPARFTEGRLGATVTAVREGSPAERAGIEVGDLIVALAGRPVRKPADVIGVLARHAAPVAVTVDIYREETPMALTLVFAEPS